MFPLINFIHFHKTCVILLYHKWEYFYPSNFCTIIFLVFVGSVFVFFFFFFICFCFLLWFIVEAFVQNKKIQKLLYSSLYIHRNHVWPQYYHSLFLLKLTGYDGVIHIPLNKKKQKLHSIFPLLSIFMTWLSCLIIFAGFVLLQSDWQQIDKIKLDGRKKKQNCSNKIKNKYQSLDYSQ